MQVKNFTVSYVAGSAKYYNNVNPSNGFALPDSIVNNTGAKLGYEQMDGKIPGCFQYAGYVTVKVKAQVNQPQEKTDIDLAKTVRNKTNGEKTWTETVSAKGGDTVQFQIHAKKYRFCRNSELGNSRYSTKRFELCCRYNKTLQHFKPKWLES